jgi:hypothetical protein
MNNNCVPQGFSMLICQKNEQVSNECMKQSTKHVILFWNLQSLLSTSKKRSKLNFDRVFTSLVHPMIPNGTDHILQVGKWVTYQIFSGIGNQNNSQPLTSQANNVWLMDDYFLTWTPPNSFIRNQLTVTIKPTRISTHKLMTCAIWRWLECVKKC